MQPDLGNVIVLPTNVASPTLGNAAFEDWAR
jgi:hypothetical protein